MYQNILSSIDLTPDEIDPSFIPWLTAGVGEFYIVLF